MLEQQPHWQPPIAAGADGWVRWFRSLTADSTALLRLAGVRRPAEWSIATTRMTQSDHYERHGHSARRPCYGHTIVLLVLLVGSPHRQAALAAAAWKGLCDGWTPSPIGEFTHSGFIIHTATATYVCNCMNYQNIELRVLV